VIIEKEVSLDTKNWKNQIAIVGGIKNYYTFKKMLKLLILFVHNAEPVEGYLSATDLMSNSAPDDFKSQIDVEKDILFLPYSSGTTGTLFQSPIFM